MSKFAEANPKASMAANIGGAMAVPIPGGLPATLGKTMVKGAAPRESGAALAGYLTRETVRERFQGAATGATRGSALGLVPAGAVRGGATTLGKSCRPMPRLEGEPLLG